MRTFSWTQLFNQIEATLPNDVMLTSVHPEFTENGVTRVNMEIQGKDEEVIDTFWQQLEKTGAFHQVDWTGVSISDTGMHRVQMSVVYTGSAR
jgi:ribosomal protein S19E (S16A)